MFIQNAGCRRGVWLYTDEYPLREPAILNIIWGSEASAGHSPANRVDAVE